MQKRVVYNFNAQTATASAAENSTGKAVKASNAISKIKRAFSGKSIKLAVLVVLLFVSLFCTIGSADWIISQQKDVPNSQDGSSNTTFKNDDFGLGNYSDIPNVVFGQPAQATFSTKADNSGRDLPDEAKQNIQYKVKPYNNETLPDESFFESGDYTTDLPTDAGTYAVLITSTVNEVSYGKAIKVFTIAPCPVKIEWSGNQGFTYDGTDHRGNIKATAKKADENGTYIDITENILSISLTYKAPGAADSTAATTVTEVKNAGTYTATATITSPNYALSSNEAATATTTFTIEQKALTVTAENKTVTYGDPAPAYTFSHDGLVSPDTAASLGTAVFECKYEQYADVGEYPITVSGLANSNYNITYVSGKLTVNTREVALNWNATSFVYDGEAHTPNPTANSVVNGDNLGLTITITGENTTGSPAAAINVGTYTATASITNSNYVIAEGNQTATFTITARALTVTAEDHEITYGFAPATNGYIISGFTNGKTYTSTEAANIGGTVNLTTNYTRYGNVGEYDIIVDISGLSSQNYSFTAVNGKLTVNKKELTVTANNNTITYGEEPSANGCTISGFEGTDNESVVTGLENITYIIGYKQWDNIGQGTFSITPKVGGLSATNYSFKAANGKLTVEQLDIQLSGTIVRDYASAGILYDKDLFSEATFTAPEKPAIDLSKLPNIYTYISNAGEAKNFGNSNGLAVTPENGLFSYTFGEKIKAGSTYKIANVTLNNNNLNLTKTEVYLKYKTAKVGSTYFTIEDALAQSGTITLCGDATNASSYVITAFAKLSPLSGSDFSNYKSDYKYTLSGKKLIIPFENSLKEKNCLNKTNAAYGNVYSALVIQNNISITLSSASITVGAELSYNQNISCALAEKHGVLSNNGTITAETGCTVSAYGYIKGTGKIILKSGAIGNDVVSIYDFPGGSVILSNMSKVFPTNAFTLHNNACETYIYSGSKYTGFTYFVLSKLIGSGTNGYEATAEIVGANSSSGLFAPKSTSGYIVKKVTTLGNYDINNISATNQRTASNTKLQHRDNIEVYGSYKDNTMELSVSSYSFQTNTDKPFPIGLMDVNIKTGNLVLEKSSYMVMPGSKIKVEKGAKLTVNGKAKLSAIKYDTINSATGNRKYTNYFSTTTDGEIIVNGELATASTAQVGGKIITTETAASIQLSNSTASYIMLIHTDKSNATLSGTVNAFGDIMTSPNSYAQSNLSAGTYFSKEVNGKSVWYSQTATISFKANGNTYSTISRTVDENGYTILEADFPTTKPTKEYYTFEDWYIDEALTTKATGQTIFVSCTLYAGWTANTYTITYNFKHNGEEYLPEYVDNSANQTTYTYEDSFFLKPAISHDGYKFYRWYEDKDCTTPISQISGKGGDLTLFGEFIDPNVEVYVVTYVNNNTEVDTPPAENVKSTEVANFELANFDSNNNDRAKTKYFLGWYVAGDTTETILNSLPSNISANITLCAKWDNKAELIISIPEYTVETGKYYYTGQTATIPDVSTHPQISAIYTVPEGYKFIGFLATAGCTTALEYSSDSSGYITGISTTVTVSNDLSKGLTITADIRKILQVDITMSASAKNDGETGKFNIDKVTLTNNCYYSTDGNNWKKSNGSSIYNGKNCTLYILSGENQTQSDTEISITINDIKQLGYLVWSKKDFSAAKPSLTNCIEKSPTQTTGDASIFTFIVTDNSAKISWTGTQT